MTWQTRTDALTPPAGGVTLSRLSGLPAWLRSNLFLQTDGGRLTWRRVLAGVLFVVAGAAASLARTAGPGALNSTWIEDAGNFLEDGLHHSVLTTLSTQMNGYYDVVPRAITAIAVAFPIAWAPGIMSAAAAAEYATFGLIVYIASGPYLRSPWLRLLIAAPVCAIPLAYTQVNNDLVTVQFFGLYGAFWTCLWLPGTRAGKVLSPLVMATVSWTAVLSMVFAPLIVARLVVDRSKNAWALAILWASGVWLQISETVLGRSNHLSYGNNSLVFVVENYVTRVAPRALFGERSLGGPGVNYTGDSTTPLHITSVAGHQALIVGAWVVVLVIVVLALTRFTDPNWTLAGVAALFSVGIFLEELLINTSVVQSRYVVAPAMLLYTALVALMRPRVPEGAASAALSARAPVRTMVRWLPAAGFAVLLLVAITLNFRVTNGRTTSPAWTSVVATAHGACALPHVTGYTFVHEWWYVTIPCSQVG